MGTSELAGKVTVLERLLLVAVDDDCVVPTSGVPTVWDVITDGCTITAVGCVVTAVG